MLKGLVSSLLCPVFRVVSCTVPLFLGHRDCLEIGSDQHAGLHHNINTPQHYICLAVHLFIDYILRPEVIAPVTNAVSYPNPNLAATALVDPVIRDDPGVYPPPEVMRRLYLEKPAPRAYERLRTRVWNRVKSGC